MNSARINEPPLATFKTPGTHGNAVQFSPFTPGSLVCAASENYGLAGRGVLFFLEEHHGQIQLRSVGEWTDCLFDVAWSESNPETVVAASGDGSLQLWSLTDGVKKPVKVYKEHTKEVYCVHWNQTRTSDTFLSGSWDHSIKHWDPIRSHSLATFIGHRFVVYSVVWAPLSVGSFASASGDGTLNIWDLRSSKPSVVIQAHQKEVLSCDWSKYNQNILVSCATDSFIKGWDLRNPHQFIFEFDEHECAVRRIKFSPHSENTIASCSYDFTTRIWDISSGSVAMGSPNSEIRQHHTEFVYGLDWNLHYPGQIADCAWDGLVTIFNSRLLQFQHQQQAALHYV